MLKLHKITAFLLFLLVAQNAFSASKTKKYDDLIRNGTVKEISDALTKDNDIYRITFGKEKNTVLMQALIYDRPYEVIRLLTQAGVKLNAKNKKNQDAVILACACSSQKDVIKYIVQSSTKPEDIERRLNLKDNDGKSPADYAAENPAEDALHAVNILLGLESEEPETQPEEQAPAEAEPEPEPEPEPEEEDVPASASINYNKVYLFDYAPVDEEIEPEDDENAEFYAKIDNPDKKDKHGRTALMQAAKEGNDWEVKSLLRSGADINLRDNDGWTALMYATRFQNNIELLEIFLQNGADTRIQNKYGSTALQIAASYSSNPAFLKRLLETNSENATEVFKSFILAITSGTSSPVTQIAKLKVFIEHGVPINRFYEGKTPLMYACEFATSTDVIKVLLENGAITKVRTTDGKTAYNFAEFNTHLEHNDVYWSLNGR